MRDSLTAADAAGILCPGTGGVGEASKASVPHYNEKEHMLFWGFVVVFRASVFLF
jgi:hypothetical protein